MEPLPTLEVIDGQQKRRRLSRLIERVKSQRSPRKKRVPRSQPARLLPGRFQSRRLQSDRLQQPNRSQSGRFQPRKVLKKIWQSRKRRKSKKTSETDDSEQLLIEAKAPAIKESLIVPMGDDTEKSTRENNIEGQGILREEEEEEGLEDLIADETSDRTMDMYLEDAYSSSRHKFWLQWEYWVVTLSLGLAYSSEASALMCISFLVSNRSFNSHILLNSAWRGSLVASSSLFGQLIGSLLVGTLSDFTGRRPTLLLGIALTAVATFVSAFPQNMWELVYLRIATGIGIGATSPPLLALASELCPPSKRGFLLTILTSFWSIGAIYVTLTAWAIFAGRNNDPDSPTWRWYLVVSAIPSLISFVNIAIFGVESPRFLCLRQRQEEALQAILKLGRQLGYETSSPLTLDELLFYYPRGQDYGMEPIPSRKLRFQYYWRSAKNTVVTFFKSAWKLYHRNMLRTTLPIKALWIAVYFGLFGFSTWINKLFEEVHLSNIFFNALVFSLAQFPGTIVSAYLTDRMPRQLLLSISLFTCGGAFGLFAYFAAQKGKSEAGILVSIVFLSSTLQVALTTMGVVTVEWFPTSIRAMAWAVCSSFAKGGGILGNVVDAYLVSKPVWLLLTSSITLIFAGIMPLILPGGKTQQSLEDDVDLGEEGAPIEDDTIRGDLEMENERDVAHVIESTPAMHKQHIEGTSYESI